MARWIKSTTQKSYLFSGRKIPQAITKDNEYLHLSDSEFAKLTENPVVGSLIKAGAIFVTEQEPTSPTQQVSAMTNQVAQLTLENTKLQEKVAELESKAAARDSGTEVAVAVAKQKAEDEAAIEKIVADKDAEIARLKEQLKKRNKTAEE